MFTEADIIHRYTVADAISDGALIDITETAREAGIRFPVVITQAAHADCIAWTDTNRGLQDESGRLWDVVFMARYGISRNTAETTVVPFTLYRVPNTPAATDPEEVTLHISLGGHDDGGPLLTIMLPNED